MVLLALKMEEDDSLVGPFGILTMLVGSSGTMIDGLMTLRTGGTKKPTGTTGHLPQHGSTMTRTMSSLVEIKYILVMMEWS